MGLKNSSAGASIGVDTTVINIVDDDTDAGNDTPSGADDVNPPAPAKTESVDEVKSGAESGGGGAFGLMINLFMSLLLVWPGYLRHM